MSDGRGLPLQLPPAAQSGLGDGATFSNAGTTIADPTVVNPVAGSTTLPMSSNMSFMLMMFGGGLDSATGSGSANGTDSSGGTGSTTGTDSAARSGSATPTAGSPDDTSDTQIGSSLATMLADLQSLMTTLTGGRTALGNATAPVGSGTSATGSSLSQHLDSIVSNMGTMVAATGSAQPPPLPGASGGPSSEGNDITNPGSAVAAATWGDGPAGPGGGWQEQFAIAAYESGNASGPNTALASTLQSVTV
jgi:hypothetical protein